MSGEAKWSHHEQALPEGAPASPTALDDAEKGIYDGNPALPVLAMPPNAHVDEKKALESGSASEGTGAAAPSPPSAPVKKAPRRKPSKWILFQLWFNTYRKFFTFVTLLNLAGIILAALGRFPYAENHLGALVLGNLLMAIMMRNELFLRFLYLISIYGLRSWAPLWLKLAVTSVLQHVGGIHSGCAISGAAWLVFKIVDIIKYRTVQHTSVIVTGIITNLAVIISVLSAFPWIRKYSNQPLLPNSVLIPWLTLREVPVEVEIPSPKVAVLKFQRGMQQGLLGRISRTSIMEYHAFGIISEGRKSGCHYMICGVQGDFTRNLVADPPKTLWTRELKFAGVGHASAMFKRGIRICTGTGIGAALSTCIQSPNWFLIWIGSDQEKTFGPTITRLIYDNIPPERMILWDSKKRGGRPDSVKLLKEVWHSFGAEVIFITSNRQGNDEMMQGCREAGLHAFGTLWDF
ncbi:hypothetical protein MYCTH_2068307 [Thermothelomyces thermophilus ATCC 42464]|uniref:Non-ribosomal peptide synthetase n=1 Tax=Thermothelomyces thermophilus (strain ATCC 42464 / BCRC 31852 / DSM 1799) TaxID=573729 RepID=G2QIM1_THET4|nr:uncharacterized protein MYCTH_2068307 [Thermothelomyces thermophilus ATCC 42464]AEO60343.1 hypothetical protein MYCTH_2068307 [Thermothelomyces thermophilus ATCC 42464]